MITRDLGTIPISIATAAPIEYLMSLEKPCNETHIFINLRTLFRNYEGSYKDSGVIKPLKHARTFFEEMTNIELMIHESVIGHLEPIFFVSNLNSLQAVMPEAKLKVPTTSKQKAYADLEDYVLNYVLKQDGMSEKVNVFDIQINGQNSRAFLLSHLPVDLLSKSRFRTLALLESHTGTVKRESQWVTKLNRDSIHDRLPFNVFTLQLLGDGNTFRSSGQKYIKPILELAEANNWNVNTTRQRIKHNIDKLKDAKLKSVYRNMLQVRIS